MFHWRARDISPGCRMATLTAASDVRAPLAKSDADRFVGQSPFQFKHTWSVAAFREIS